MKRLRVDLDDLAAWDNLLLATWKAARGKRDRPEVAAFLARLDDAVAELARAIRDERAPLGSYRAFAVRDPKPRLIHAAPFADRVLHHAILNRTEAVFERGLVADTFACRPGLGSHAAVRRVQAHLRHHPWVAKVDVAGYFPSIDHGVLKGLLARRFKGEAFLALLGRIVDSFASAPGRGLPIGSLTSQHFANLYLDGADRWLLARSEVRGLVRYMDDMVWWCDSGAAARAVLAEFRVWLQESRHLTLKANASVSRSDHGLTFCGYRITPGALRLTPRKARRYREGRQFWERAWAAGEISTLSLQARYMAVLAPTRLADARAWRQRDLQRHPSPVQDVLG